MNVLPWDKLNVDPEQSMVLALARAYALDENPTVTRDAIAFIAPSIRSWTRVDSLLHVHRIKSLSYQVMRNPVIRDSGCIPADFVAEKRDWYTASFARTVIEPTILHRLLDAFSDAEIPVLSIKGLTLGVWLYGDVALREHDDIDLLVPAHLGEHSDAVLEKLGYGSGYRPPLYPGESPATASYQDSAGGIPVDLSFDPLHIFWQSAAERRTTFAGWWSRRQDIHVGGSMVSIPGPEDQLLLLARHLQFHGYFRVNWAVDLMVLLRRFGQDLDWPMIATEAERHGISGGIVRTLELLKSVYGIPASNRMIESFRPSNLVQTLHRRIWPDSLAVPRERTIKEQEGTPIAPRFLSPGGVHPIAGLSLFALDPRRTKYFLYLGQRIVPPPSWLRETYGEGNYPRLLRQHWSGLRSLRQRVRTRNKR
jgi:hypothetical protein